LELEDWKLEIGDWRSEIGDPARVSEDKQDSLALTAEERRADI
jgi:hypothetical protein